VSYLCANFILPRPLCSRLRPEVRDRHTSDTRQTDRQTSGVRQHRHLMPPPVRSGGIIVCRQSLETDILLLLCIAYNSAEFQLHGYNWDATATRRRATSVCRTRPHGSRATNLLLAPATQTYAERVFFNSV